MGDPFSHGTALQHFSGLSDLPVPLAWPPSTLASGVGGGKQSTPDHESSMRPSYDQGCIAAIGAVCPEQGAEQLCGVRQHLVGWVALAGPAALQHCLAFGHQMHFLLLSSPVGLNFPPPGALWLGQGLERLGGGGQESFKITQGVDISLAVML